MRRSRGQHSLGDVVNGFAGAGMIAAALLTPFLRRRRLIWVVGAATADRSFPGDDLVARLRWAWTHAIDIDAPAEAVWPWVSQIGADRAGFYSYQWLENLVGCQIRNADEIHPDWAHRAGGSLLLHPKALPLQIVAVEDGRSLIAYMAPKQSLSGGSGDALDGSKLAVPGPVSQSRSLPADQPVPVRDLERPGQQAAVWCRPDRTDQLRHGPAHADRHKAASRGSRRNPVRTRDGRCRQQQRRVALDFAVTSGYRPATGLAPVPGEDLPPSRPDNGQIAA
jgi:hypothetical protein